MRRYSTASFILLVLVLPQFGLTQDKQNEFGIFATRQDYYDFMGEFKSAAGGDPEMELMIPLVNDIVLQRPVGWSQEKYGGAASQMGLLSDMSIRKELELVDEQYERLKSANEQVQQAMSEKLRSIDFSKLDPSAIRDEIRKIQAASVSELNGFLLPHQLKRLRQLSIQRQLRVRRLVDLLTNNPLKDELEIDPRQSEDLLKMDRKIQKELEQQIAKLRREAQEKLLRQLKPQQQKKFRSIVGELKELAFPNQANKKSQKSRAKK